MIVKSQTLDASAITLSSLCMLHCLALPIVVSFLPASMLWIENEWVHKALVLMAIPITLSAILRSKRISHRAHTIFAVMAMTGLSILCAAAFAETLHDWEEGLTIAGGLTLSAAHLWRWTQQEWKSS